MSSQLCVANVLNRVAISMIVPIIIRIIPIYCLKNFIKSLNLLQIYELFHFSLFTFHFFSYLCTRKLQK